MADALEQRAVAAAVAVASASGVEAGDPTVIYSGSNVLVRLGPAPVVARVMTGTIALHDDPRAWLRREISVLEFLAPTQLAVRPSRVLDPGPHCHDGLWMTFTEWIPGVAPERELALTRDGAHELGGALRDLHEALRPFQGDLGGPTDLRADIERLLAQLRPSDAQECEAIAALQARLNELAPEVFASALPIQPLHGDVSPRNLLWTSRGRIWNDFEDTFRGPVHWDLASYVGSFQSHGAGPGGVRAMLDGYGWDEEDALAPFLSAQDVYDEIWRRYDRQRRGS